MRCLYCGMPLAIIRMLVNGTFCCDEHRDLHEKEKVVPPPQQPLALNRPAYRIWHSPVCSAQTPAGSSPYPLIYPASICPISCAVLAAKLPPPVPRPRKARFLPYAPPPQYNPAPSARIAPSPVASGYGNSWPPSAGAVSLPLPPVSPPASNRRSVRAAVTPLAALGQPVVPKLEIGPARPRTAEADAPLTFKEFNHPTAIDLSSQKLRDLWHNAPGDLKLIAMVVPMVLLLTLNAAGPKLYTKPVAIKIASQPMLDGMLTRQWNSIRKTIAQRAGFNYADDFRSGLDAWTAVAGSGSKWSYDKMGFVRPTSLSLFRPTLQAVDYEVEFTGRFEQRALGFVFRASDPANYQAVKLVLVRPGPLPEVHLVRYTVLNNKEGPRTDKLLPVALAQDTFFTVRLDVRGNDFTLMIEEKMADFWSDGRLKSGGIGFFCGKGESSCLRHVSVSHQNDTLGRFCAFIASEDLDRTNGS